MFDLTGITLFCLEKRLSKHKITIFSKILGEHGSFGHPGYAYVARPALCMSRISQNPSYKELQT